MPFVESTCCMNCHKLLWRIAVLEIKLLVGLPKQAEHTADCCHRPLQHTASESQQFISYVERQTKTDCHTNRWHKQGARPKGTRDVKLSRVSRIAAMASSSPDTAMTKLSHSFASSPQISTIKARPPNHRSLWAQCLWELSGRCHNTRTQTLHLL